MHFFSRLKNTVAGSSPVSFLVNKSKQLSFPGFRGIPLYDVIQFFYGQVRTIGMTERASAIAFNFFMAIPPAVIFLFTMVPLLPISKQFEHELYGLIRDVIPGEKNNAPIIHFLRDFINHPRNGLLSLGFLLSLFFSSNAMMGIMRSFDKNYIGFRKRRGLEKRGVALKLTLIIFVLVFVSILLIIARDTVLKPIGIRNAAVLWVINTFRWVIVVLLFLGTISTIYRYAPAVQKKWRLINPGSILATFLMLLCTLGFSWYVSHFGRYNELYGSIGTVLILMLLIYFNSLVLLIGFELNVSIASLRKIAEERNNMISREANTP